MFSACAGTNARRTITAARRGPPSFDGGPRSLQAGSGG